MASKYLDILCRQCGEFIVRYKKEGSGQLIRLYLDKITEPKIGLSFTADGVIIKKD